MRSRLYIILFFFFGWLQSSVAQHPGSADDTSVYRVYGEQFASMLSVRGLPGKEIEELLKIYKENNISSDESLANLLGKLYPADKGIGIIFYFFKNDTLRRVFFKPGIIIEKKLIAISKESLLQISADFNHQLGLYASSANRLPVKRGVIIKPPPASKGLTYAKLIRSTTALLLPEAFDSSFKHLIILPALNIGTLPFQLLSPYGDSSLLVDRCSFTVSPGIIDLIALRIKMLKAASVWSGSLSRSFSGNLNAARFTLENPLFVSNPAYPQNTEYTFPDLPGAKKEIDNAIPYAVNYKLLEGAAAVRDSVMKYLSESDVAYFATHGMANAEEPKKSFLVLSGDEPFLTVQYIMENKEKFTRFPEMVILSACQTGLGKAMEAGVAGLARAFLLCGSNHVIMSLWNVDDEATAYLMNRFLYHLQIPSLFMPSEPLRKAMLDTRKKYPDPSQWSSFTFFGIDF
jgi:CHAT domain-containing protein